MQQTLGKCLVGRLAQWLEEDGVQTVRCTPLFGVDRARRERWMRSLGFRNEHGDLVTETRTLARWTEMVP